MKVCALLLLASCVGGVEPATPESPWVPLFDGRTLTGWAATNFGGEGDVHIEDGSVVLEIGEPLTGITWTGEPPAGDYEVRLEVARLVGSDFFCGLTFPVGASHCTLILGGWGGALVGLSTVDGRDASENDTRDYLGFDDARFYDVRVRVTAGAIEAFLDGERIVSQPRTGHRFGVRPEVALSRPFGIASFRTAAAVRRIELRQLRP